MASPYIQLFDASNIDQLQWPSTEDGRYTKDFLEPLIQKGVSHYIDNIVTKMMALRVDNHILPITINDAEYENSYVCSPYGRYILYAIETLTKTLDGWKRKYVTAGLQSLGKFLRSGKINKIIFVNNWLFSTDLYPELTEEQIKAIKDFLIQKFPDHSIAFRSINAAIVPDFMYSLKKEKFDLIPSQQIYYTNTKEEWIFETRIVKSDLKLLQNSSYNIVEHSQLTEDEIPKIQTLYVGLYQDKHSKLTPNFNLNFFKLALNNHLLDLKVLKKDGKIDGIIGSMNRHGILFCPVIGYDREVPQDVGLYRQLSTLLMLESKKRGSLFHQAAGASFYKKTRRAKTEIEYYAVYSRHLSFKRRMPWLLLKGILNLFGVQVMKKY